MVNFPGRDRRRRVLKDEVLTASTNHRSLRATVDADASNDVPRYSDAAGVENHPQVTDFVPRRFRSIAIFVLLGIGLTAMLTALDYFTLPIAAASGMQTTATLDITSSGSLAAWFSAVVLLIASATCLLTYSIRRHRIDDFQGRYRVWLGASFACLVMSANSVAGLHQILADVLGHVTGWTALHGAVWWLVLPGVPMGWILVRAVFDMRECRLGAVLLVAAMASYAASMVSVLGFARVPDPQLQSLVAGAALLFGHWLMLASLVSYARFVVLDAQGLITVRRRTTAKRVEKTASAKPSSAAGSVAAASTALSPAGTPRRVPQSAKTPADSSRWVDGSRPERDRYDRDQDDDTSQQKMSKSDRKRLRKLKAQSRAA